MHVQKWHRISQLSIRCLSSFNQHTDKIPCIDPTTIDKNKILVQQHMSALVKLQHQPIMSLMASYSSNFEPICKTELRSWERFQSVTKELENDPKDIKLRSQRALLAFQNNLAIHAYSDALKIIQATNSTKETILLARQIQIAASLMMKACLEFHDDLVHLLLAMDSVGKVTNLDVELIQLNQHLATNLTDTSPLDHFLIRCLKLEEYKVQQQQSFRIQPYHMELLTILQKALLLSHLDLLQRYKLSSNITISTGHKSINMMDKERSRIMSMLSLSEVYVPIEHRSHIGGERSPENVLRTLREVCDPQVFENVKITIDREKKGFKMIAKRDIEEGEIVLEERAWLTFSNAWKSADECHHCLADLTKIPKQLQSG
jgi:hypothetical protein